MRILPAAAIAAFALASAISPPATGRGRASVAGSCPLAGGEGVAALHRAWIEKGWEHHEGDPPFDFRAKLGRFYDWKASDGLFFDDFDPKRRAVRSVAAYAAIWEPIFKGNRSARHMVSDGPHVLAGTGDLSASSIEFTARIEPAGGTPVGIATRSDLVWRCRAGGWRIVREHNSSKVIPVTEAEAVLRRAGRL